MARRRKKRPLTIAGALLDLEKEAQRAVAGLQARHVATRAGVPSSTYSSLKNEGREPTLDHVLALASYYRVSVEQLLAANEATVHENEHGVRWRVRGDACAARERMFQLAADGVLRGHAPAEVATRVEALSREARPAVRQLGEAEVRALARSGVALGLVEVVPGDELEDPELAARLAEAIAKAKGREIAVRVVRNVVHPGFERDPIAPFAIGRLAHRQVARFLETHPLSFTIGLAGGRHVSAMVRTISASSSPFPTPDGDKKFTLVPLTLEPFYDHGFALADALVGEFASKAADLLGPRRVRAASFKPFGFLIDRHVDRVEPESVLRVRQHYADLDVAIYGCGDKTDESWISHTMHDLGLDLEPDPVTDVCLNMLAADGREVPLPHEGGRRREYLGVSLKDIALVAGSRDRLALLLTSGRSKGVAVAVIARAGYANAIVCDQAAARGAIEELSRGYRTA